MSIPSSSALVVTTPFTSPDAQPLLDLAAAQRQIAAAVSAHHAGVARLVLHRALDGREQDLGGEPALGEDDRRDLLLEQARGELGRLAEIRRADAELRIDDGRVVAEEDLLARRRAALRDLRHRFPGRALGQLARVGDGRRRHDELRRAAVVAADALEPAQDVGEMAAEDAPVRVQLVDHHVAEVLEELRPLRVVRQDARVQHVGIGQHEVRASAHRAPRVLRRVAVVREHPHVGAGSRPARQLRELVLGERLGRKQVERRAPRAAGPAPAARAGCSRASCPRPSASRRRRSPPWRRSRPRAPGASRAAARRALLSASTIRGSRDDGKGAKTAGRASKWR